MKNSGIEWCDHTFNPWLGWGAGQPRVRTKTWGDPRRWASDAAAFQRVHGRRQRVFCASLADVFDNEVMPAWRDDLFALIEATPELDWLLLTKRIGNVFSMIKRVLDYRIRAGVPAPPPWPWPNVWIGATVVDQAEVDRDVPKLLAMPAAVRFLSIEPILGPVDLDLRAVADRSFGEGKMVAATRGHLLQWVIAGGESGPGARPPHPAWIRSLRDQCSAAGVPFLFKQWGEWAPLEDIDDGTLNLIRADGTSAAIEGCVTISREHNHDFARVGKALAGRLLDGLTHDGFPLAARSA